MRKAGFIFTKEAGEILRKYRVKSMLSQTEVAVRMGMSKKSGYKYISRLEMGRIKYPLIQTILTYLIACGVPWVTFFNELSKIYSKKCR